MPWEFEFNDKLLLVLAYAMTSRHTFDYSFDNWQERERDFEMREKVWYECTKICDGCWKVRTDFKTQVVHTYVCSMLSIPRIYNALTSKISTISS